jgi:hypothetical protein
MFCRSNELTASRWDMVSRKRPITAYTWKHQLWPCVLLRKDVLIELKKHSDTGSSPPMYSCFWKLVMFSLHSSTKSLSNVVSWLVLVQPLAIAGSPITPAATYAAPPHHL